MMFRDLVPFLLMALLPMATNADEALAGKARTILAENCIDCHGPDKKQRKAKLRLDLLEGATKDLGGYQAIMPGKPDQSELIARLVTDDEDDLMPPKKKGKSLTKKSKPLGNGSWKEPPILSTGPIDPSSQLSRLS